MTVTATPAVFVTALGRRLRTVGEVLAGPAATRAVPVDGNETARLFDLVVRSVHRAGPPTRSVWLLLVALDASFPTTAEVDAARRAGELRDPLDWGVWLLDRTVHGPVAAATRTLRLVTDGVVVDVGHVALHDTHTGIQRVLRQTLPIWAADPARPVHLVAWHADTPALRTLTAPELDRVLRWGGRAAEPAAPSAALTPAPAPAGSDPDAGEVVVPWGAVFLAPDVPDIEHADHLVGLARAAATPLLLVGYDCIPVVSPQLMPPDVPGRFALWLQVVKHARRVAAISDAAAVEFGGFAQMTPTQGLPGPEVVSCPLPTERDPAAPGLPRQPVVLTVGSYEPRKNHLTVLAAAETLWNEGLGFEVLMIGGNAADDAVSTRVEELRERAHPVRQWHQVSDAAVLEAYRTARVLAFPSLHEGYGLPVAEAFAAGLPVVTSAHGSTGELLAHGGGLAVVPTDVTALTDALRALLTDDALWTRLHGEIAARPERTWRDYADELWARLVAPDLVEPTHPAPVPPDGDLTP